MTAAGMPDLFASGRLIDAIFVIMLLEIVGLTLYRRATGRGIAVRDLLPTILAGGFLLLALRLALAGADWTACCASLAAAGIAHVVDLARRWRG